MVAARGRLSDRQVPERAGITRRIKIRSRTDAYGTQPLHRGTLRCCGGSRSDSHGEGVHSGTACARLVQGAAEHNHPIIGPRTMEQLEDNLGATNVRSPKRIVNGSMRWPLQSELP